jgi:hypothetical protein
MSMSVRSDGAHHGWDSVRVCTTELWLEPTALNFCVQVCGSTEEKGKPTRTSSAAYSRSKLSSSLPHSPAESLLHWMWFLDVFSISPIPAP